MTMNPQPAAAPAGNKNKTIWIGLGVALLFCCGAVLVAGLVLWQAGRKVQQGLKTSPEEAAKAGHAIVDYTLPNGYEEKGAMDLSFYSFVMIGPKATTSNGLFIMLAQFDTITGVNSEQMEKQLRQSFEQQSGQRGANMKVVEVKNVTIRGQETSVAIYEGTDQAGRTLRQLITSFPAKQGTAMLMIMAPADQWDQDLIDNFIESIR